LEKPQELKFAEHVASFSFKTPRSKATKKKKAKNKQGDIHQITRGCPGMGEGHALSWPLTLLAEVSSKRRVQWLQHLRISGEKRMNSRTPSITLKTQTRREAKNKRKN